MAGKPPGASNRNQLKFADYHLGLTLGMDDETRERALATLARTRSMSPEAALMTMGAELNMEILHTKNMRYNSTPLCVVELRGCHPELTFAGEDFTHASTTALNYISRTLRRAERKAQAAKKNREVNTNRDANDRDRDEPNQEGASGCA